MTSIQDVPAEELARLFHHYQEALAHDFDCHSGEGPVSSWDRTPQNERKLMVAAARLALLELAANSAQDSSSRKYFAKPGEADWGC
jgi:NADPH-dependent ferric siderophore reductase